MGTGIENGAENATSPSMFSRVSSFGKGVGGMFTSKDETKGMTSLEVGAGGFSTQQISGGMTSLEIGSGQK